MLPARRDPILDHGTHDAPLAPRAGHAAARPTGFARLIAGLQIAGTVLGIPLGLASGYSIYRANFSPEATCGSLRASIISMLDKNADASTLRLLVRRDVATFEHSCAAVDPDAVAAFRTLLAKPRAVAVAKDDKKIEKKAERKPETMTAHTAPVAKPEPAQATAARAEPVRRETDAQWLDAVRHALTEHNAVARAQAAAPQMLLAVKPAAQPVAAEAAPPLPPATAVANAPAPDGDGVHPVPPGLIPNVGPAAGR